jgi:hypothetical protein
MFLKCRFLSRRKAKKPQGPDDEFGAHAISQSIESSHPDIMRAKVAYFVRPRLVEFQRSRAPSPESINTNCSGAISNNDEAPESTEKPSETENRTSISK